MQQYIIQPGHNTQAGHCATMAGHVTWAPIDALAGLAETCRDHTPIGSVEWTREWARIIGLDLPEPETYPWPLRPCLRRAVRRAVFWRAHPNEFVKPVKCKAFTGGIQSTITEDVDPDEICWVSDPVTWGAEWRCYVLRGQIVGVGQYDEGPDADLDLAAAQAIADAWPDCPAGYALDVGMLDGRLALVEVNDGWALGYYSGCSRAAYLSVIDARWRDLREIGAW